MPTKSLLAMLLFATGLLVPATASAATVAVNTTADQFNTDPAHCSLREAVNSVDTQANFGGCAATGPGYGTSDTVSLPAGTYQLTLSGSPEDSDASGDLDTFKSMSVVGTGNPTIQQTVANERVIDETATSWDLALSGLTITAGQATGGAKGAGIHFDGGAGTASLSLDHVTVTDNHNDGSVAGAAGAGIYTDSPTTITNSTITDNTIALGSGTGNGGGIYQQAGGGGTSTGVTLTIQNSSITNNSAANGSTMVGSGGGIYRSMATGDATSTALIEDTAISDNTARNFGGGIYSDSDSPMNINRSLISGNSALNQRGGGIQAGSKTAPMGKLNLVNSTVTANSANGNGGGIESGSAGPPIDTSLLFSTLAANTAPSLSGTDLAMSGLSSPSSRPTLTLEGNLIGADSAGNTANDCNIDPSDAGNPPYFVTVVNNGYNVTDTATGLCGFGVGTGPGDHAGLSFPLVGPLGSNGGPTKTMIPTAASLATDLMPNATCTAISPAVTTDQRGYPRPDNAGANCDAGAYEQFLCNGQPLTVPGNFDACAANTSLAVTPATPATKKCKKKKKKRAAVAKKKCKKRKK